MIRRNPYIFVFVLLFLLMTGYILCEFLNKEPKFVLRIGHDMPTSSAIHLGAVEFKKIIEKRSNGEISIQVFASQKLGTDPEMVEMVQSGELAMAIPPTSKIVGLAKDLGMLDLPYLFESREQLYKALDGDFGKALVQDLDESGILGASFWESGYKHFTASKEISNVNDLAGQKMRVMISPVLSEQVINLDSFPINVDFHKLKSALLKGMVDIQENSLTSIYTMEFTEAHRHLLKSHHGYLSQLFILSKKKLLKLPRKYRNMLVNTAKEVATFQRKQVLKREQEIEEKLNLQGVEIQEVGKEFSDQFVEKQKSLYFQYGSILRKYVASMNPKIRTFLINQIPIGINLSFSEQAYASALSIKRGVDLAIKEINQNGGILGRKLLAITKDHGGFPAEGKNNLDKLVNKHDVVAIIGGMHSPVILNERARINDLKVPYLVPWAAASAIITPENPYLFRYSIRDEWAGKALLNQAAKKGNHIALILENTPWGKGNEERMLKEISKKKSKVVSTHLFEWGEKDFSDILKGLKGKKVDSIIFVGNAPEGIYLIKALYKSRLDIPVVSHWGIAGGLFWNHVKRELKEVDLEILQTFILEEQMNNENVKELFEKYKSVYSIKSGDVIPAPLGTIHSYELTKMLAKAIKNSGNVDRENVAKNLRNISKYKGIVREFIDPFQKPDGIQDALDPSDLSFGQYNEKGEIVLAR